jgi:hypothetical protein
MGWGIKMDKLRLTLIFLGFMGLVLFSGVVSAANVNWTVNPGDSIQAAVNNASSGDIILVNDNNGSAYTYTENVVINKTVQLQATGGECLNLLFEFFKTGSNS